MTTKREKSTNFYINYGQWPDQYINTLHVRKHKSTNQKYKFNT